jgi:hypothetical protein
MGGDEDIGHLGVTAESRAGAPRSARDREQGASIGVLQEAFSKQGRQAVKICAKHDDMTIADVDERVAALKAAR